MDREDLRQIGTGLYRDEAGTVYIAMRELLTAQNLPDRPEVRAALWESIRSEFSVHGDVPIKELEE